MPCVLHPEFVVCAITFSLLGLVNFRNEHKYAKRGVYSWSKKFKKCTQECLKEVLLKEIKEDILWS